MSRRRAEQSIAFTEQYRAYVINYGLGEEMVRAAVEADGRRPAERWAAMRRILSGPTPARRPAPPPPLMRSSSIRASSPTRRRWS